MWAIDRRDFALARQLIRDGASVVEADANGQTPLHRLCHQERWYIAKDRHEDVDDLLLELLAAGADVNAADHFGNTPLHNAVTYQTTLLAEVLIAAGADIMRRNVVGETPLTVAAWRSD